MESKIYEINSISGNEREFSHYILSQIKDDITEYWFDKTGNLITRVKGKGKATVFATFIDEPGVFVSYINEKGQVFFNTVGKIPPISMINEKIIINGNVGIVSTDKEITTVSEFQVQDLYIDFGISAEKLNIKVGDFGTYCSEYTSLGDAFAVKSAANKTNVKTLIDIIKNKKIENDTYFCFCVQGELRCKGAISVLNNIDADYFIELSGTVAEGKKVKAGEGAVIKVTGGSLVVNPELLDIIKKSAQGIKHQYEFANNISMASVVSLSGKEILCGGVSIPVLRSHTSLETVNKNDIDAVKKLIIELIDNF